jgi:hypothetical protein
MHITYDTLIHTLDTLGERLADLDNSAITELERRLHKALAAIEDHREAQRTAFTPYDADPRSWDLVHTYR